MLVAVVQNPSQSKLVDGAGVDFKVSYTHLWSFVSFMKTSPGDRLWENSVDRVDAELGRTRLFRPALHYGRGFTRVI